MHKTKNRSMIKKVTSLITALAVAMACYPATGAGMVFADEGGAGYEEETVAYVVNEDGSETEISREALEALREESFQEIPEDIEVVFGEGTSDVDTGAGSDERVEISAAGDLGMSSDESIEIGSETDIILDESAKTETDTDADAGTVDDADLFYDEEGSGLSEAEDAVENSSDWAAEESDASEQTVGNETAQEENSTEIALDPEGLVFDEDAKAAADASSSDSDEAGENTGADDIVYDGGNVEHIQIPALMGGAGALGTIPNLAGGDASETLEGYRLGAGSASPIYGKVPDNCYTVNIEQSGSTVTVTGNIQSPYFFYGLFVDTTEVASVAGFSVNERINMNNYSTGYHTVLLRVGYGTSIIDLVGRKFMVSNTITARPTYNGVFEVYSNYLNYYPYNMAFANTAGDLYMEYSANKGKTWQRSGYMRANMIQLAIEQGYKISGLKAKKKYKTRIRYGVNVTYSKDFGGDGKSYFFGGPVLNTTTIKTGAAKKPKIRSVTAEAVNVKYHQIKHYGKYTGVYLYTERFYTCKIKVTVRLKSKPGTKGMWLNGKWIKGNKKVYTKVFSPYPNYYVKSPGSGRYKYQVTVRSGQSAKWGGYSPIWSANKRIS